MKKSNIKIFLTVTLSSSALFTACILPNLNLPTITQNMNSYDSQNIVNQLSTRIAISEIEDLDTSKVSFTNMAWPKDVYNDTNGYDYLSSESKKLFRLSAQGLTVDKTYPTFSRAFTSVPADEGPGTNFPVPILSTDLTINGQTYDASLNEISTLKRFSTKSMAFGGSSNQTLRGVNDFNISSKQPYMKVNVPFVSYPMLVSNSVSSPCPIMGPVYGTLYDAKDYVRSIKDNQKFERAEALLKLKEDIGPHLDRTNGSILIGTGHHYHSATEIYTAPINIFNDYNQNGILQATHISIDDNGFNSLLPKLTVNDSLLDKTKNVLEQDLTQNNLFKIDGGQHIPTMGGYSLTAEKTPTTETILFTYKPKFWFDNGNLVEYSGPGATFSITGFAKLRTFITPLDNYNNNIVVDRFIKHVTVNDEVDANILGTFLDLSSVPPDVTYEISEASPDNVSGILKFKITSSNCYSEADTLLNKISPFYNIKIQLTPRITNVKSSGFLDDILVNQYYDRVFDEAGLINLEAFNKYSTIIAPVDNAQYYLIPESYKTNTGDGTVDFKLYASTYYEKDGEEHLGDVTDSKTHFDVNLKLNPLPSKIVEKTNVEPTHRVDKFFNAFTNLNDIKDADFDLLKHYVDIENIPTGATYSIDSNSIKYDSFNDDFYYEYVNFDLKIDKFNETSFVPAITKTLPLRIKLDAVHLETEVVPKGVDAPERVDRLLPRIINEEGIVTNRSLLEQYVDIKALPKRSVLSIDKIILVESTGKLSFDLKASVAYDNDSNELLNEIYPIELQLGIKHIPTTFTPIANITDPERVDRFAQELKTLDSDGLKNYLFPKYIEVAGEFPIAEDQLEYKISELSYEDNGSLKFKLIVNSIYNKDSDPENNYGFPITLNLGQKFAPTNVSLYGTYPNGSTITQFKDMYTNYKDNQADLRTFLSRFLKGVDTIPDVADIDLNFLDDKTDVTTGKLVFKVQASAYYDANSDLVNPAVVPYISDEFELHLIPEDQIAALTTTIDWRVDAPSPAKASDFYKTINPNNQVDFVALDNYFTLKNIPVEANITIVNHDPDFNNQLLLKFDIVLTQWWDTGTLKPQSGDADTTKTLSFEKLLFFVNTDSINVAFPWWWVALGISGLILILIVIFKYREIKRDIRFKHDALSSK